VSADSLATGAARPARRVLIGHDALVRLTRAAVILLLFAIWQIYGQFFADKDFVSPPSRVAVALFTHIFSDGAVMRAVGLTLVEVSVAFAASVIVGLGLGILIGWNRGARRMALPVVLLLYAIPQVVMLPLVILLFGIGPTAKIFFGFSHGVFPVVINVVAGMRNVNPLLLAGARSMGASRIEIARHVMFPHMVPSLFAGLRLSMTVTLIGVILAELYVSLAGIGYYTQVFAQTFDPAPLFALIAVLAAIAIMLNVLVRVAERRVTRWRRVGV
jgi:NitT/TauT family transport system permease protein